VERIPHHSSKHSSTHALFFPNKTCGQNPARVIPRVMNHIGKKILQGGRDCWLKRSALAFLEPDGEARPLRAVHDGGEIFSKFVPSSFSILGPD
jgi:hypothetical protein